KALPHAADAAAALRGGLGIGPVPHHAHRPGGRRPHGKACALRPRVCPQDGVGVKGMTGIEILCDHNIAPWPAGRLPCPLRWTAGRAVYYNYSIQGVQKQGHRQLTPSVGYPTPGTMCWGRCAMDLRAQKTQKSITDAFFRLRAHKPLEKITVRELCREAPVNRSTFYAYYKDVYD